MSQLVVHCVCVCVCGFVPTVDLPRGSPPAIPNKQRSLGEGALPALTLGVTGGLYDGDS